MNQVSVIATGLWAKVQTGQFIAAGESENIQPAAEQSQAAATEYSGWRDTLVAIGVPGPEIRPVHLPVELPAPTEEDLAEAAERFVIGNLPLVLVVGSHEPRKNHLAVLHAAELLWRQGLRFSLTFVRMLHEALEHGRLSARKAAKAMGLGLGGLTELFAQYDLSAPFEL